jgi:ferritin-like metal-binding protein YciE
MNTAEKKVVQYLTEARATEDALTRVLQSQIAMTPRGSYRSALEKHLNQTRRHSARLSDRMRELGAGSNPLTAVIGFAEEVLGQALALSKAPLDLLRGGGGDEKVLKNAKDTYASEALEIATYAAIERLARAVGDATTAKLAADILAEERAMLERVETEIPKLTDRMVGAEVFDDPSFDLTKTGAADALRDLETAGRDAARSAGAAGRRTARQARKVPGVAQAEGQIKGAVAGENDLAIAGYDGLTADEIVGRLPSLSQVDLAKIDSYERRNQDRSTVLGRLSTLRGTEPWPGYDELTVSDIQVVLANADDDLISEVRGYERSHKDRAGVLRATERETVTS